MVRSLSVPAPVVGESPQLTPLLLGSKLIEAVKAWVVPAGTVAPGPGEMETVIAGTVTLAVLDFDGSATEVAVMLTARSLPGGGGAGAL